MKLYQKIFFILCFIHVIVFELHAQWTQLPGPPGGYAYCLSSDSVNIMAGVENGIYLLRPGSKSWERKETIFDDLVLGISNYQNYISVLTANSGAYYSTDTGQTWYHGSITLHNIVHCMDRHGSIIFAGMDYYNKGLISRSIDNGVHWGQCLDASYDGEVDCLAHNDSNVIAGTMGGVIYKSTNNGDTWNKLFSTNNCIEALYYDAHRIIAGCNNVFWISNDDGSTWDISSSSIIGTVKRIISYNNRLYAPTITDSLAYCYESDDHGKTWHLQSSGIGGRGGFCQINAMANRDSLFVIASVCGLYSSVDNAKTWQLFDTSVSQATITSIVTMGKRLIVASQNYGLCYSDDNGWSWSGPVSGLPQNGYFNLCTFHSLVFATCSPNQLFVSADSGCSWKSCSNNLSNKNNICLCAYNNSLYLGSDSGVFVSHDTASSWQNLNPGIHFKVSHILTINNTLFANLDTAVYRSVDGGNHWIKVYIGAASGSVTIKQITPYGPYLYGAMDDDFGIFYSSDNGASWVVNNSLQQDVFSIYVTSITSIANWIFASTIGFGVITSNDYGNTWYTINDGLNQSSLNYITILGQDIISFPMACGAEFLPLSALNITSVKTISPNKQSFILYQNYPNPFNPSTTINYKIPYDAYVHIKIYDILGREVTTLVDSKKQAGTYSVTFNGGKYASGIYFYRIDAGTYHCTKKLLLIK